MEPELTQQHTATTNVAKSASGFFDSNGSVAGRRPEHKERSEEDLAISVGHGLLKEILQSAPCPGPTPVPGSTVTGIAHVCQQQQQQHCFISHSSCNHIKYCDLILIFFRHSIKCTLRAVHYLERSLSQA